VIVLATGFDAMTGAEAVATARAAGEKIGRSLGLGKLDDFATMAPGIPAGLIRIELPLGPGTDAPKWADIVAKTEPLASTSPRRRPATK